MAEPLTAETAKALSQLRDIHLPELSEAGILADWAAGASLGLLAAVFLTLLGGAVLRKLPSHRKNALVALTASRTLEPAERLLAQAKILQAIALQEDRKGDQNATDRHWSMTFEQRLPGHFFTAGAGMSLRDDLYRPEPRTDPEAIDREILRLLKRRRG
ncbi:DUF4381 domain-containing protein [Pelagibius sp. Alg239-R121]|uniref:DUF4381 domain-containing protein n=1 Tax=Pelagibius sp. Alg239-R121 TaxID=2993448 RepID=UPI0024A684DB|nr:DUF4381 domain-containing protein [Pelagibius sp. Alg239-R121]